MKVGTSYEGTVYVTRGLRVGTWSASHGFEPRGVLPEPSVPFTPRRRANYGPLNRWTAKRLLSPVTGWYTTTNVWPVTEHVLLATVGNQCYRSVDGGWTWSAVCELPTASGPMGTLPSSLCRRDRHGGRLYLAEYTFDDEPARILSSDDLGASWSTFLETTDVRHFHGIFEDPYADRVWATTGDRDDECAIGYLEDGAFHPVGGGDQRWRAVGLALTPEAIIWGMDCSYAETVSIFRLARDDLETANPTPEQVGVVDSCVFYADTLTVEDSTWVILTTSPGLGVDDTAPAGSENTCSRRAQVVAASSHTNYETWHELFSFERRRTIGEHVPAIPAANAYVFLTTDEQHGVVVNPFNTATDHGTLISVSPEQFALKGRDEATVSATRDAVRGQALPTGQY